MTAEPSTPATPANFSYASPDDGPLKRVLIHSIETLTGQRRLFRLYTEYAASTEPRKPFWPAAVEALKLDIRIDRGAADAIPASGPIVVVANHPFGVVDGLVLAHLVARRRNDFRLLVHTLLTSAPEPAPWLLPIDFTDSGEARRANAAARNTARAWLAGGGALLVFPGGTVSTAPSPFGRAIDPDWQPFVTSLIVKAQAPVLPVFFEGQNSPLFQVASHISQTLRLALLFREVARRIGDEVHLSIGEPIPSRALSAIGDRRAIAQHLRKVTYELGGIPDPQTFPRLQEIAGRRERARPAGQTQNRLLPATARGY